MAHLLRELNGLDEAVDGLGAELDRTDTKVVIHDLAAEHADVLVRLEGLANVDLTAAGPFGAARR